MQNPSTRKKAVSACVVVSDLHCGCRFGLCPPGKIVLDSGAIYQQSRLQRIIWKWWDEFWNSWIPNVLKGRHYCIVVNGDVIDGVHHNTVTQISHNLSDQMLIARMVLSPLVKRVNGRLYIVRGTEAHSGKSGQEEEKLATMLGLKHPSSYGFWIKIKNKILHFSHHIGSSTTLQSEPTALARELATAMVESARWKSVIPDCIVRSHRHTNMEIRTHTGRGPVIAICTAGWQLKTPYIYKLSSGRVSVPQIGGSVIIVEDDDIVVRHFVRGVKNSCEVIIHG